MKKRHLIYLLFSISLSTFSQEKAAATASAVAAWHISEDLGTMSPAVPDTLAADFQNTTTDHFYSIANAWNGNLGSPTEAKIYFDRTQKSEFLFLKPYNNYYQSVEDYRFFNVKSPYSNVSYYRAGPSYGREERFKTLFAVNVNPRLNVGFNFDYLYGRGVYLSQSSNDMLGGLFGSYTGKHYQAHGIFSVNNYKNFENGGIKDERYITNPQQIQQGTNVFDPQNIETNLAEKNATSQLKNRLAYYNQKYRFGFEKQSPTDSTKTEFVPVTTLIHTLKIEGNNKYYTEQTADTLWYLNTFDKTGGTDDRAGYFSLKNTVGIELNEEFNTLAHFGMTAFASLNHDEHSVGNLNPEQDHDFSLGGILAKQLGGRLKYNFAGEYFMTGHHQNDFTVSGNMSYLFPVKNDTVEMTAVGFVNSETADPFIAHYTSNHFEWENNFEKEYKTHIGGRLSVPTRCFELSVNVENITNYIYFNHLAMPAQDNGNVQIVAARAKQDFTVWRFHLDNQVVFQQTSNAGVLPLPDWAFYHNLYFKTTIVKVLNVQLGADLHWHTKYYAPSYMPATGLFHVQSTTQVGNYPLINIYGNFHLKQMRFFVMYYHANYNISKPEYFSMPHYPINPSMLKIGLSWNFYD